MISPFHEPPGKHNYGDIEFEWRPLLKTPCYGFNGPNACYSNTCKHNPKLLNIEQKCVSKVSVRNVIKRANDSHKPSLQIYSNWQMDAFDEKKVKLIRRNCDELTKNWYKSIQSEEDTTNHVDLPLSPTEQQTECISTTPDLTVKKYAFNPLSKPFHPSRNTYSNASTPTSLTSLTSSNLSYSTPSDQIDYVDAGLMSNSSECSSIDSPQMSNEFSLTESNDSTESFVCILCPEKFQTLNDLKLHITKKIFNPYICIVCGDMHEHKYLLHRHMKLHRGLRAFTCRACNKHFRNFSQLRKHFDTCRFKLYIFI